MAKQYKPGQFISLGGTLYRVSKLRSPACHSCPICPRFKNTHCGQLMLPNLCEVRIECGKKLPIVKDMAASHPIPLKPKRQG